MNTKKIKKEKQRTLTEKELTTGITELANPKKPKIKRVKVAHESGR